MTTLFAPPKPPSLPPPPPLPTEDDPAVEEARKKRRLAEIKRKGRRATILTSGLGDGSEASVNRPRLTNRLGGE